MTESAAGALTDRKGPDRNEAASPQFWRGKGEQALFAFLVLFVALVAVLPLARLLWEALAPGGQPSLATAEEVLTRRSTWRATLHSLEVSLGGTVISLLLGSFFAFIVALTDIRAKAALVFCFMLPMMIPPQVTALSWIQVFGPSGSLLNLLGLAPPLGTPHPLYSREGIILLLGIQHAPLVFLALRAGLRALPKEMVEAARASGASGVQVFQTILLPLMVPSLVAGTALAFVSAIGNFGIPAMLGIPARYTVLPTLIYQRLSDFGPDIISQVAVLSVLVSVIAAGGFALQAWLLKRRDYRTIGAPSQALSYHLGKRRGWVEAFCWLVILFILVLPLAALSAASLVKAYGLSLSAESFTLQHYTDAIFRHDATARGFFNSLALASGTAVLLIALAVPLAYFVVWRRTALLRVLNALAELPYALPGAVLAIAAILVFLKPLPLLGFSIYGTLWIIFAAYLARFLTLGLRPVISGFYQLDRSLEEAAQMAGAGFFRRLLTIILPLTAPVAAAGGLLVFLTAFNEIQVSALLTSSGAETIGVIIFFLDESGSSSMASAVAVMVVAVVMALMLLASGLSKRLPRGVLPWEA